MGSPGRQTVHCGGGVERSVYIRHELPDAWVCVGGGVPGVEFLVCQCFGVRHQAVFRDDGVVFQTQDQVISSTDGLVSPYVGKVHDLAVDDKVCDVINRPRNYAAALVLAALLVAGVDHAERPENMLHEVCRSRKFLFSCVALHVVVFLCRLVPRYLVRDADGAGKLVPRITAGVRVRGVRVAVPLKAVEQVVNYGKIDQALRGRAHAVYLAVVPDQVFGCVCAPHAHGERNAPIRHTVAEFKIAAVFLGLWYSVELRDNFRD